MSLNLLKRREEPMSRLARMKVQAQKARERIGPMAVTARDAAADRLTAARGWTAPRLERAAHAVEDNVAPRVSSMMSATARRIDPGKSTGRRLFWPAMIVLAVGTAIGVAGLVVQRRNATKRWTEETFGEEAAETADKAKETADSAH